MQRDIFFKNKLRNLHLRVCKHYCNWTINGNARFTTVPLNIYLINNVEGFVVFLILEVFNFNNFKMFYCDGNVKSRKPQLKINSFQNYKHWYLIHTWSATAFENTGCEQRIVILVITLSYFLSEIKKKD